jgi:predicted NUDIX family phosphoesterase
MDPEQKIMVIDREALFGEDFFEGFKVWTHVDFELRILENCKYLKRGIAECDPTHKQPIGYAIIVNPALRKVFVYRRSVKGENYHEKRLQGKWSWGVGGHIEEVDVENPIHGSVLREIEEEIEMDGGVSPRVLGYINDDSNDVGKVHFGVLYIVETDSVIVRPKDLEADDGRFMTMEELEEVCGSPDSVVEEWSKIALEPLREYFDSL